MRFIACSAAFTCLACFADETKQAGVITLTKSNGTSVRVPASGPLANATARGIARDVTAFDKRASSGFPRARKTDPEVAAAVRRVSQEIRDDVVDRLELMYRVADTTSGPLDTVLLQSARKGADMLKQIMSAPPPASLNVRTEITASIPNAVLHYCLRGDYKRKACSWKSYTAGDLMPIGLYVFRVQAAGGVGQLREEEVLLLHDPTKRTIAPLP